MSFFLSQQNMLVRFLKEMGEYLVMQRGMQLSIQLVMFDCGGFKELCSLDSYVTAYAACDGVPHKVSIERLPIVSWMKLSEHLFYFVVTWIDFYR
tara:strand:- start:1498 stop:1782 length:285 start_codon:yes stop_codon:yes gene_type:complete